MLRKAVPASSLWTTINRRSFDCSIIAISGFWAFFALQPIEGLTSTTLREIKDHPASFGVMCGQSFEFLNSF
jgi:hypothetical protein